MNESEVLSLVFAFKDDISSIQGNVQEIKDIVKQNILNHPQEVKLPDENEISLMDAVDGQEVIEEVPSTYEMTIDAVQYNTLIKFEYMQSVTGIVICAALLLVLGVQLFQTFNKHWR